MNVWGITHQGMVRNENQDTLFVRLLSQNQAIAVVYDGMGGARAGKLASAIAAETFQEQFDALWPQQEIDNTQKLISAATEANAAVHHRSTTDSACFGMGTTMVAVLAEGTHISALNEGDSRAYHITPEEITKVTRDHSLVQDLVERGELTPEEARVHPHKNFITRALGAEPQLNADLFTLEASEGDYILLCSDGLSNQLADQEILYEVIHGGDDEGCCQRLIDIALKRGAPDNVTVALIKC